MNASWLWTLMIVSWCASLIGGLGSYVLTHFNGKRLEAYCRLKRNTPRFGEILDGHEQAASSAMYLLLFALVLGSLSAGIWLTLANDLQIPATHQLSSSAMATIAWYGLGWLFLLTLAGLWLPRVVVYYSSALFIYHSWPFWRALNLAASPLVGLGNVFSWIGQRLSDEPENEDLEEEILEDEIRTMVTAGQRDGVFSAGIPEMIQGVMDLDETDVAEIMTPRSLVDALDVSANWMQVLRAVSDCGRTRIPVYEGHLDNVVGILFVKDLLTALAKEDFAPGPEPLRQFLRKPWFIPGGKPVDELLRVFLHNRNHMAIVVDEYHQFIGVVTIEDALEQIVGEITDELDLDEESEVIYHDQSHTVEAEGKVRLESLNKLLGIELPESDDYDTIGGLVIHRLSRIPEAGTRVELDHVIITVLRSTKRTVLRVRIELQSADPSLQN
jgi:putative hemolysin